MVICTVFETVLLTESTTETTTFETTLELVALAGVPVITPAVDRLSPAGRAEPLAAAQLHW
jgi:hypothetical protein